MADEYLLEMKDIVKTFPGVKALDGAGIKVKKGEVVALCGENGAGKSTLMKCLYGSYHADSGEIYYQGKKVNFKNPDEAKAAGVILIFQELSLITDLTVAENMFLGSQPKNGIRVDWKKMNDDANAVLKSLNSTVKATDYVRDLPISQQQMVEIARGIALGAKILILDEPTSSLTEREKDSLFEIIRKLKAEGVGIIYISHKMDEIFEICDSAVVLRDGKLTGQFVLKDINLDTLIQAMIGRTMDNYFTKCSAKPGKEILRVEGLTAHGYFRDISFNVHEKEVVGFYGLVGAGRSEIMESIFGCRHLDSGKIYMDGKEIHIRDSSDAVKNGIGFVTENRKEQGLLLPKSCRENMSLAKLPQIKKGLFVDEEQTMKIYDQYHDAMEISSPSSEQPVVFLSGGNQQKVVIGKWLAMNPRLLILDEPTRGIDIGAKSEIHSMIAHLAEQGLAVIVISSEMPEIMGVSNRIYTMAQGRITGELTGDDISEENLMRHIVITDSTQRV
ncbi:MAG: sugar ABC transporter ATP-binding protein [Bilifractor sp.]|jgi:ABC-type sugar transport system ATPase subunit